MVTDLLDDAGATDPEGRAMTVAAVSATDADGAPVAATVEGARVTIDPAQFAEALAAGETAVVTVAYDLVDVFGARAANMATLRIDGRDGPFAFFRDGDGDSVGVDDPATNLRDYAAPAGYAAKAGDADDRHPTVYPGAPEINDGKDNDQDGAIDEDNRSPETAPDLYVTAFGAALNVDAEGGLLGNDDDPDDDPLTVTGFDLSSLGTITVAPDGSFAFTPTPGASGTETLGYTASDGLTASEGTYTLTVEPNPAPIPAPDAAKTDEDAPVEIAVLANDTDDGPSPTVFGPSDPANGAVSVLAGGAIRYTPAPDFHGADSFTYTVRDADGATATADVDVTVDPVDDAPVFTTDAAQSVDQNETVVVRLGAADVDDADGAILFALSGGADQAAFALTPEGDLSFQSAPDWEASASTDADNAYQVEVTATSGAWSATQALTVTVENVFERQNTETGTPDSETLTGGDLEDEISTGGGLFDKLNGGGALDVFVFDDTPGERDQAFVTDYTPGEDAIDLNGSTLDSHFSWAETTYLFPNGDEYDLLIVNGAASLADIDFV